MFVKVGLGFCGVVCVVVDDLGGGGCVVVDGL